MAECQVELASGIKRMREPVSVGQLGIPLVKTVFECLLHRAAGKLTVDVGDVGSKPHRAILINIYFSMICNNQNSNMLKQVAKPLVQSKMAHSVSDTKWLLLRAS